MIPEVNKGEIAAYDYYRPNGDYYAEVLELVGPKKIKVKFLMSGDVLVRKMFSFRPLTEEQHRIVVKIDSTVRL